MTRRLRRRWLIVMGITLSILSAACIQLSPMIAPRLSGTGSVGVTADGTADQATDQAEVQQAAAATVTPARTASAGRQTVAVRRGTITELLPLNGRVAALEESPVRAALVGRVASVLVEPGQTVEQGQVLLQAETTDIQRELTAARSRVELSTVRLEQAKAQAQARHRQAEQRIETERFRQQRAVVEAQTGLRRAAEDLTRVKAGAPAADRRAAEAAIISARSGVERAEAELVRASAGPSEAELKSAEQQVWAARLAVQRAEADFAKLKAGPDPIELRAAEREVSSAQSALDRARLDLERLVRGDPTIAAAAQREVQRAELALRTAQATRIESGSSRSAERSARASRDAAVASARLSLQDAQARLADARRGPPPAEIEMARRAIQSAESALQTARERYETVNRGPDELALATANQAIETARAAAREAERRYLDLESGPPQDRVASARDAVVSARTTLSGAMDRLAELNSRPTRAELQDAEDRVHAAQVAVEQAQSEPEPIQDEIDPAAYDLVVLEKNLEQDRGQVGALEQELIATNLAAPTSGVVSAIMVRAGDPLDRDLHVLSLATRSDPIVTVEVGDGDVSRLTVGQRASVGVDGATGTEYSAWIMDLVDGPGGVGKVARLGVEWAAAPRGFGSAAHAIVTLREKSDVLLVPQRALRTSGQRRYVEYLEGDSRRTADVTTGISGAVDVEILSGLREGQLVVVGTASSSSEATSTTTTTAQTSGS